MTVDPADPRLAALAAALQVALVGVDPDAGLHCFDLLEALRSRPGCRITGCSRRHCGLGLCLRHYRIHTRATRNEAHLLNRRAAA